MTDLVDSPATPYVKMKARIIHLLIFAALPLGVHAASVSGVSGRALLENLRDNYGGNFINFTIGVTPMPSDRRLDNEFSSSLGVTFSTFQDFNLQPIGPHNVYVSAASGRQNTIVGTPSAGSSDDGRYPYQIVFSDAQRYAGLQRIWNDSTLTRFYDGAGNLLHEAVGTGFQGYQADTAEPSTWVRRIEITGNLSGGSRQVGYSDDLFFGTVIPETGTAGLLGIATMMLAFKRRPRLHSNE
jgi:hypothetical protein